MKALFPVRRSAGDALEDGVEARYMVQGGGSLFFPPWPLLSARARSRGPRHAEHILSFSRARFPAARRSGLVLGATRQGKISFALSRLPLAIPSPGPCALVAHAPRPVCKKNTWLVALSVAMPFMRA